MGLDVLILIHVPLRVLATLAGSLRMDYDNCKHEGIKTVCINIDSMPVRHQKFLDQEFVCLDNGRFVFGLLFIVQTVRRLDMFTRAFNS